jgi:hypothetical protein
MQSPDLPVSADQANQLITLISQLVQFSSHVATGAMSAHVIQWLKQGWFAGIWKTLSDRGKILVGLVAAALPAAGISLTFQHPATGHYVLDIQNLTLLTALSFVWSIAQSWAAQQTIYNVALKPTAVVGSTVAAEPVSVVVAPKG